MEHEIIFTGIGGQGIQLMAKVLAQTASDGGRRVMLFGVYGGMMRGGPSESTVVIADEEIVTPPIVPACWSVVAMHPSGLETQVAKLRADGLLFRNETLVADVPRTDARVVGVPATRLAEEAGNLMGAGMVLLGAFVTHTRLVPLDAVEASMRAALPAHRQRLADVNAAMLRLGAEAVGGTAPARQEAPA